MTSASAGGTIAPVQGSGAREEAMGKRCSIAVIVVAAVVALAAGQVGASVGAKQSNPSLTGTWSGTWRRTSAPPTQGTMEIRLQQKGKKLSGSETVVGSACLTTHDVTGKVKGDAVTFNVTGANVHASYSGSVSGKKLSGTLEVTCGSATGTGDFTLKRT